jgi:hypothetical protein
MGAAAHQGMDGAPGWSLSHSVLLDAVYGWRSQHCVDLANDEGCATSFNSHLSHFFMPRIWECVA